MTSSVYLTSNSTKVSARWRRVARKLPGALDEGVRELAEEAIGLYQKTTETWKHKPAFETQHRSTGRWTVGTDDKIFGWVDKGTRPHIITARNVPLLRFTVPFRAKTKPGYLTSYAGSRGSQWVSKHSVRHPGTKARHFSRTIHARVQQRAANRLRQKLLEATSGSGVGL